jgi:rhomboid protease GluP
VLRRRTSGSVVCPSCGSLVGVRDDRCYTCGRANPGLWGFGPALRQLGADFGFVPLVIGSASALYLLTLLASGSRLQVVGGAMSILAPSGDALRLFGMSGYYPVFVEGAWWTVLSASWLHGNFLHILFNMMWVRDLGAAMVDLVGAPRTIIIYVVSGICGFLVSSALPMLHIGVGAPFTMGASAAIFGLLGALVHYGRKSGSRLIHGQALNYAIILFVMGLIMPGVDNSAHAGGFAGGYAMSAFFNPLAREKGDHLIAAIVCLAASLLAVVYSVFSGLVLAR